MAPRASPWRSHTFATNSATVRSEAATKMTSSQTTAAPLLQNEHEMEMEMDPVALMRGDGPEERWEAISDLDAFFSRVYEYFHERGLRCILASRIISLLSLAFTIALTVFLFELLNLEGLVNDCRDEESCSNHTRVPVVRPTMRGSPFVWLYVLPIFSCYWLWTLRHFVKDLRPLLEMRDFYRDRLQIDDDELHNIAWDAVVQRIVELNDRTRLCIVKEQLTPHDIANRILRKENFMVAFVNRDLLPLQWPPPLSRFDFLTKTLEWNLYLCILDAMFDGDFKVRRSFTQDVHGVRRLQFNFMVVGALNALAFPFIAVVMLVHFFIEHFEELYAAQFCAILRNSAQFSDGPPALLQADGDPARALGRRAADLADGVAAHRAAEPGGRRHVEDRRDAGAEGDLDGARADEGEPEDGRGAPRAPRLPHEPRPAAGARNSGAILARSSDTFTSSSCCSRRSSPTRSRWRRWTARRATTSAGTQG